MTKLCYADKSLFFTGLIAESLAEVNGNNSQQLKNKTALYLAEQFKEQGGTFRYYETESRLHGIVKPDVDDNAIVLSTLMNYPELIDPKKITKKIFMYLNSSCR